MKYDKIHSLSISGSEDQAVLVTNPSKEPYLGIFDDTKGRYNVVKSSTNNLITLLVATKLISDVECTLSEYPDRIDRVGDINYIYKNAPIIIDNM